MLRYWAMFMVVLGCFGFASKALAHPSPTSVAFVDFTVDGARIEQTVPLSELEAALHRPLVREGENARQAVKRQAQLFRDYVDAHVRVSYQGPDIPWVVSALELDGKDASEGPELQFVITLHAPGGRPSDIIRLRDDVVAHEVVTHHLMVYVRSDWAAGVTAHDEPKLLGTVHAGHVDLDVPRRGTFFRGLRSIVTQGIEHITSGTDHLVFLFSLLLVAPVSAAHGRWREGRSTSQSLAALLRVVTAFTLGHSLTLALGAVGLVALPNALVEGAIAASIVVTAAHALRPIFPRREALVAAAFGLVHGLAFASTLVGRDLGRAQTAWTIFAFNVGIEIAQLTLLGFVVPWLLVLAKTSFYRRFRAFGALAAGTLAVGWLLERTFGLRSPAPAAAGWLEHHPLLVLVAFATMALTSRLTDSLRPSQAGDIP